MKYLFTLLIFTVCFNAHSQSSIEDRLNQRIEQLYIDIGEDILNHLEDVSQVHQVNEKAIDIQTLRDTLHPDLISVVKGPLVDRTGSLVDAIGQRNLVTLDRKRWERLYVASIDLRVLVLHEMMRSAGINDDNYFYSSPLMSKLDVERDLEGRVKTPYCDQRVAEMKTVTSKVAFTGFGYAAQLEEIDPKSEAFKSGQIFLDAKADILSKGNQNGFYGFEFIEGNLTSERRDKRIMVETRMAYEMRGYRFIDQVRRRSRSEMRVSLCIKLRSCAAAYKGQNVEQEKQYKLARLIRINRCEI